MPYVPTARSQDLVLKFITVVSSAMTSPAELNGHAWFTVTLTSLSARPVHSHCWFVGLSPCSQATSSFITCVWGGPGNELSLVCCLATRTQPTRYVIWVDWGKVMMGWGNIWVTKQHPQKYNLPGSPSLELNPDLSNFLLQPHLCSSVLGLQLLLGMTFMDVSFYSTSSQSVYSEVLTMCRGVVYCLWSVLEWHKPRNH